MKLSNRSFAIVTVCAVGAACFAMAAFNNGWFGEDGWFSGSDDGQVAENDPDGLSGRDDQPPHPGWVKLGGVWRPPSDAAAERERNLHRSDKRGYDWGQSEPVAFDTNANTRSLKEAVGNSELDYRFTSMLPAPAFDREAYLADPQKYLDEVAPGRINQSLAPSKDVVPIKRQGGFIHRLVQGESVLLKTKVEPGMPVTFHSPKLGHFQNRLTSVTVRAGDDGIASATYTASGGTRGEIDLRASSPVHSDTARWVVEVVKPLEPGVPSGGVESSPKPTGNSGSKPSSTEISQAK